MRYPVAFLITFFTLVSAASADYVEVRRDATIKDHPEGEATVLARPPEGTNLVLFEPGQTNGYYHIRIPPGLGTTAQDGFIYRTLVRGFPGDPPGTEGAGTAATVTSEVVYQGIPVNQFPEFPITVLDKGHFVVGYSEDFKNPAWVFYRIGPAVDFRSFPRPPKFETDANTQARVRHEDYTNSGFDRGHMAPNFAMGSRFGAEGAKSTFIMSNICPQYHSLNDGQWGDLEEWIAGKKPPNATAANFIHGWADEFGEVWVLVGPLFEDERDPLPSGVPVPSGFFCVVIDEQPNGQPRALAFLMPQADERVDDLAGFLTTIDAIESRSGLDLFPLLPDAVENAMEGTAAAELWPLPVAPN